jgi:hypothetical protein
MEGLLFHRRKKAALNSLDDGTNHFLVRIRGAELRIRFHTMRQPPGLIPARFPKIGGTGNFRSAERWKKRLETRFYQEIARAKTKMEIHSPSL